MKRIQVTENELKNIIQESVVSILMEEYAAGQVPMQQAPQQQNQGFLDRAKRVKNLNATLVNVWKEADALGLTDVKKWLGMAIASLDKEFIGDTVSNGFNKAKETVKGWLGN